MSAQDLLRLLAGTRLGPVEFSSGGATVDGQDVGLFADGSTVLVESRVEDPQLADVSEAEVSGPLRQVALAFPGLAACTLDRGAVVARVWLDGETATGFELAEAASRVAGLAVVARDAMANVVRAQGAAERLEEHDRRLQEELAEIDEVLEQTTSGVTAAPPPAPPSGRPRADVSLVRVTQTVSVYDYTDTSSVAGQLIAGTWCHLHGRQGDWAHISDDSSGLNGWVPSSSLAA